MNLDTQTWGKYRLGDLFDIKKGKRLTAEDQTEGLTPYIGAIDSNNGISNHIGQNAIHSGNTISLSYNGSVGEAFYQPNPFWATDDVNVLYFKDKNDFPFNKNIALFICTILRKEKYRYCYGRKWTLEQMNDTIIQLPSINGKPDWQWIDKYISGLHNKPISTKKKTENLPLNTNSWKEFYLHKLFKAGMGNGIDAVLTTNNNPKYNYVSRKSDSSFESVDEIDGETPFPKGSITLALGGSLGSCFIHNKPFYTAQNVAVLQEKEPLSIHTKLFIATLIRNECKIKYQAFGRELNAHFRKDFTIKLPVLHDKNEIVIDETKTYSENGYVPDWKWMDSYMKTLPYSDRI